MARNFRIAITKLWIFDFVGLFVCLDTGYKCISHFDNQKATFQGGVKCDKSAADRT